MKFHLPFDSVSTSSRPTMASYMRRAWVCGAVLVVACSDNSPSDPTEIPDDASVGPDASSTTPDAGKADSNDPKPQADGGGAGDADSSVDLCPDGFARGVAGEPRRVVELNPAPEGVAVCANGDVFVSIPDESKILRVPLTGAAPEVWTTLAGRQPLGMTCSGNALYVVDFRSDDAAVLRVTAKDDPGTALPKIDGDKGYSALNAIVAVPGLGLFASDGSNGLSGRIVFFAEMAAGVFHASVAKGGIAFPNGLAFEPQSKRLDVALTLPSKVLSFSVGDGGVLDDEKQVWSGTPIADSIDGIALDEKKDLYVAHYLQGYVGRPAGKATIAKAKDPKSLAFRGGTLLFTSSEGLHAVDLGICGVHP